MLPSVRAFLSGIIDYAGLFPPAKLPLEEALRNYARYRTEPAAWMLGRFVCPVRLLDDLAPYFPQLFGNGPPLRLCVLSEGTIANVSLGQLESEFRALGAFCEKHRPQVAVDAYEVRLDSTFINWLFDKSSLSQLLATTAELVGRTPCSPPRVHYEIALQEVWGVPVEVLAVALRDLNAEVPANQAAPAGLKIRCGGLSAANVPPPELITFFIETCCMAGVPWKATAGLHHPIRRYDANLEAPTHGFLNVFGAGILAHANVLHRKDLVPLVTVREHLGPILEEEDASAFHFDAHGFHWRDLAVTTDAIARARSTSALSFGSCSFDEPRDDLRALGLLT
jgi:hypothetical protein